MGQLSVPHCSAPALLGAGAGAIHCTPLHWLLFIPLQESDLIRLKREAKAKNGFYVEPEAKLLFVIRIRGMNDVAPKVRAFFPSLVLSLAWWVVSGGRPAVVLFCFFWLQHAGTGRVCRQLAGRRWREAGSPWRREGRARWRQQ